MADPPDSKSGSSPPAGIRLPLLRSGTALGLILKILLLATVAGLAVFGAFPLIEQRIWAGLAVLIAATAFLFYIYISPRNIPAKYLVPGTVFLLAFQVFPVLYTIATAFTNFGDGHRGTKQDAIARHRVGSRCSPRGRVRRSSSSRSASTAIRSPATSSFCSATGLRACCTSAPARASRSCPPPTRPSRRPARSRLPGATPC